MAGTLLPKASFVKEVRASISYLKDRAVITGTEKTKRIILSFSCHTYPLNRQKDLRPTLLVREVGLFHKISPDKRVGCRKKLIFLKIF